jgi:hypothetical protein
MASPQAAAGPREFRAAHVGRRPSGEVRFLRTFCWPKGPFATARR